jgi:hypothetical protein
VKESEDSKMDEKIKRRLKEYKRRRTEEVAAAISNWKRSKDMETLKAFLAKQYDVLSAGIHAIEIYANKSLDELKALYERLQAQVNIDHVLDVETWDHVVEQMAAVNEVLSWHGWQLVYVNGEARWVRIEEDEEAE